MALIGAIKNVIMGSYEKKKNSDLINELEEELEKNILDGFTEDEKLEAEIMLKQADLEIALVKGLSHKKISLLEKEIIELMETNIKKKMDKLKEKEATQLDIANTMIAIQKTNKDVRDYVSKMEKDMKKESKHNNSQIIQFRNKYNDLSNKVNNIVNNGYGELKENIDSNSNHISEVLQKYKGLKQHSKLIDDEIEKIWYNNEILREEIDKDKNSIKVLEKQIKDIYKLVGKQSDSINELDKKAKKQKKINVLSYICLSFILLLSYKVFII
ncbi:MAG: hypothetical protein FH751_07310 [Firmicutes bacterium]|nr:hypothetical protein [Bacillota bacterium]